MHTLHENYILGQPKGAHRRQHTGGHGTYSTNLAHWDSQKVFIDASIQVVMALTLHTGTAKRCL